MLELFFSDAQNILDTVAALCFNFLFSKNRLGTQLLLGLVLQFPLHAAVPQFLVSCLLYSERVLITKNTVFKSADDVLNYRIIYH